MAELVNYWESSAQRVARRAVPRRQAQIERSYRRRVALALRSGSDDPGAERRETWRKWPGTARADRLAYTAERRARLREAPRKNEGARARRSARRRRRDVSDVT